MRFSGSNVGLRRAFTLIEMMVVVLLISVLTALIIPEMKGTFEDALLRTTSRQLLDAFALASSRAVTPAGMATGFLPIRDIAVLPN